jgi:hypothetical protein
MFLVLTAAEKQEQQRRQVLCIGGLRTNKPLQIACLQVSEDKGRSIGLVFVIWQAANKARAQSCSSDASAAAGCRKAAAGLHWAMARYSRIGGIGWIGVSCREWTGSWAATGLVCSWLGKRVGVYGGCEASKAV